MMQCGKAIRLTWKDKEDLQALTGFAVPPDVRTIGDLQAFIERSKAAYACDNEDFAILCGLFDRVTGRLMRERIATPLTYRRKKRSRVELTLFYLLHGPEILLRAFFGRKISGHRRRGGTRAA